MLIVHSPLIRKYSLYFMSLFLISACAQSPMQDTSNTDVKVCNVNDNCSIKGHLTVYVNGMGGVGVLDTDEKCLALSLPTDVYEKKKYWDGALVKVEGIVYAQPSLKGLVSYEMEGRSVLVGVCDTGKVLHVTEIHKYK